MKNKKKCFHKNGFKSYVWVTPNEKKMEYKKCVKCGKRFRVGELEV